MWHLSAEQFLDAETFCYGGACCRFGHNGSRRRRRGWRWKDEVLGFWLWGQDRTFGRRLRRVRLHRGGREACLWLWAGRFVADQSIRSDFIVRSLYAGCMQILSVAFVRLHGRHVFIVEFRGEECR